MNAARLVPRKASPGRDLLPRLLILPLLIWPAIDLLAVPQEGGSTAITKLKPLCLETSLGAPGSLRAAIVTGARYQTLARDLAQKIEELGGIKLRIVSDAEALQNLKTYGNLIALGHYGNNQVLERLYFRWYLVVDGSQPGAGGYTLQTVHNPEGSGNNVIVVGGSDDAGVQRAADRLLAVVRRHGTELPRLHEVELGIGKEAVLARAEAVADPKRVWPTLHPMEVQQAIAETGLLYVYTGQERFAQVYKSKLTEWLKSPDLLLASDDLYRTIIVWDLLEESPVFSDEQRLWITNRLLDYLRKEYAPYASQSRQPNYNYDSFMSVKDQPMLRENHRARFANSFFFGGRYFEQYYGLEEADRWLRDTRTYWEPQMKSFMTLEGSVMTIAMITLTEAVTYALADGVESFLSPQVLGRIADRGLMCAFDGKTLVDSETPCRMWCLAAHLFGKPEYLSPIHRRDPTMGRIRMPWVGTWELGRSFWDGTSPREGEQPVPWVQAAPLDAQYYEQCLSHGPKNVSPAQAFEFLVFKPQSADSKQYLALGGHNTNSYSADSANAITEFWSHGQRWLHEAGRVSTVHKQVSVSVVKDGGGAALPAFAKLEHLESQAGWGMSRTAVLDYNGTDWRRNLLCVPNKWFLVIDEIRAKQAGDYLLENRWSGYMHAGFDDDDLVLAYRGANNDEALELRLIGTGWQRQYLIPWLYVDYLAAPIHPFPAQAKSINLSQKNYTVNRFARRWAGRLNQGERHLFGTLFYVQRHGQPPAYRLREPQEAQYVIAGADGAWAVCLDPDGKLQVKPTKRDDIAPGSHPVAATASPPPVPQLTPRWAKRETARVLCAAALRVSDDQLWAVGLADGRIHWYRTDGTVAGSATMPGRVLGLAAVDLDGDNRDEIVAGSDTGGVRAFTADGSQRWIFTPPPWKPNPSWRQSMGIMRTVITDLIPLKQKGTPHILAFGLYYYVLDPQGKLLATYDLDGELGFTDLVGVKAQGIGRTPENTLVLAAADLDGDGHQEIVGDVNDHGYPYVRGWSSENGKRMAGYSRPVDRYLGSAIKAVVAGDFDGDGKDEFVVGADAFTDQLSLYRHPEGLVWKRDVGGAVEALTTMEVNGMPEIIVGTELGQVEAFNGDGNRRFTADVHGPVTAVSVTRGKQPTIWVVTLDGRVMTLNSSGAIIGAGCIGGYLDHICATPTGVLVTSADGHLAMF